MFPRLATTAFVALALLGCRDDETGKFDTTIATDLCPEGSFPPCETDIGIGTGGPGTDNPTDPGEPEVEDPIPGDGPAQSDRHLFVVNPIRNTLTRVDAYTRQVRTTPVGRRPRLALVTADLATVAVLNEGDDTVSLVDAESLTTRSVPVRDDLNRLHQSPDGAWLVLWHDPRAVEGDAPPPEGIQAFTEVSLIHVESGEHHPISVGLNPRNVVFTPDGRTAVVVTDFVLAVIDLSVRPPAPEFITMTTDLDAPRAEELALSPDGHTGLLRRFGDTQLFVIDFANGNVWSVDVGANPTDLDVTPDGRRAVALARTAGELWTFDLNDPLAAPEVLAIPDGLPFGQLVFDPRGQQALLYTNAEPLDRYGVWSLTSDQITVHAAVKPVEAVTIAPAGGTALLFHGEEDMANADPSSPFYEAWAITVLSLDDGRTNPLKLPARVLGFAHAPDGTWGTYIMEEAYYLDVVDYRTLLHDELRIPSLPAHVGVMSTGRGPGDQPPVWVSQEHELGRITFYDRDDGSLETITGFELNGEVEIP